jgi:Rrf2 family nitric oxide-sensitive transcriptional repressor
VGQGVLRSTEPPGEIIDCHTQACPLAPDCLMKHALDDAQRAFYARLDSYTLADVARGNVLTLRSRTT